MNARDELVARHRQRTTVRIVRCVRSVRIVRDFAPRTCGTPSRDTMAAGIVKVCMRCAVCSSAKRSAIEGACELSPIADVAAQFGVSERSLARHIESHPRAAAPARPASSPPKPERRRASSSPVVMQGRQAGMSIAASKAVLESVLDAEEAAPPTSRSEEIVSTRLRTARCELDDLLASLRSIASALPKDATISDRIAVLRASVPPIKLLGQLTGEIGASETTVATSPHYRRIRSAILDALRDHPAALKGVIDALERVERGAASDTVEAAAE